MAKKYRIALILVDGLPFPNVKGGAIETLLTLLAEQNEIYQKLDLEIYSIYNTEAVAANNYRFTKTHYIKVPGIHQFMFKAFRKLKLLWGNVQCSYYYHIVYQQCKNTKYDVIVFEGGCVNGEVFQMFAEIAPLCYHLHYNGFPDKPSSGYRYLLAVSDFVKNSWNKHSPAQIAYTVQNGINLELFNNPSSIIPRSSLSIKKSDFVVLYVGRIIPEKGVLELLSAIESLDIPELKLLMIGSANFSIKTHTDYEQQVAEKVHLLGDRVIVTGYISNEKIPAYYALADIQVIPSVWEEAAGLVAIEGMASGLPLVVTYSGGMVEYVDRNAALIVEKDGGLSQHLADAIQKLYQDPVLRLTMGEKGKERAKKFSAKHFYENMVSALELICTREHRQ